MKSKERECLNKVIDIKDVNGKLAQTTHKLLVELKDKIVDSERPDFIAETNSYVIGIEHCLVDVFFKIKRKQAHSLIRTQENEAQKKIDEYKEHPDLLEKDIHDGTAAKFTKKMLEERFDHKTNFNYSSFIDNFQDVCSDHDNKCNVYRKNIFREKKQNVLGCIVEIPYPSSIDYLITDMNLNERRQTIKGVPFTSDMLQIIGNMTNFDFVIICMYCYDFPDNKKMNKVYYFAPHDVKEGVEQQKIRIHKKFDYFIKDAITITCEQTENGYTFIAKNK